MNVLRVVALFVVLLGAPVTQQVRAQSTIDTVQPTIVKIFGAGGLRNLNAYSTGILVEERGYVMTVWNHVLDTSELTVVLSDGRRYSAEVVDAEPALDVAVLRLQSADETFPAIRLADAADVTVEVDAQTRPVEARGDLLDMGGLAGAVVALDQNAAVVGETGEDRGRGFGVEDIGLVDLRHMLVAF